jgi:hypothetical protein
MRGRRLNDDEIKTLFALVAEGHSHADICLRLGISAATIYYQLKKGPDRRLDAAARFWKQVDRTQGENACWPWTGHRNWLGYGQYSRRINGKRLRANAQRVAYRLHYNVDPGGLLVCHTCDNPPCCNPKHLFLGNHRDNALDMVSKGRGRWQKEAHKA